MRGQELRDAIVTEAMRLQECLGIQDLHVVLATFRFQPCMAVTTDPMRPIINLNFMQIRSLEHDWREVLAHEMRHVWQAYSGKLRNDGERIVYEGERYTYEWYIENHSLAPWEVDANEFADWWMANRNELDERRSA